MSLATSNGVRVLTLKQRTTVFDNSLFSKRGQHLPYTNYHDDPVSVTVVQKEPSAPCTNYHDMTLSVQLASKRKQHPPYTNYHDMTLSVQLSSKRNCMTSGILLVRTLILRNSLSSKRILQFTWNLLIRSLILPVSPCPPFGLHFPQPQDSFIVRTLTLPVRPN